MTASAAGAADGGLVLVFTLAVARMRAPTVAASAGGGGDGAPTTGVRVVVPCVRGDVPAAEGAVVCRVPAHGFGFARLVEWWCGGKKEVIACLSLLLLLVGWCK